MNVASANAVDGGAGEDVFREDAEARRGVSRAGAYDVERAELPAPIMGATTPVGVAPDRPVMATDCVDNTSVILWSYPEGRPLARAVGHTGGVGEIAFTPDGKSMVTGSDDGTIRLWTWGEH